MDLIWGLVLSNCIICFADVQVTPNSEVTDFTLMSSPEYGAETLGHAWISPSLFSCVVSCQKLYTSCYSIAYNNRSGSCTPGSIIKYGVPPLSPFVQDEFYYGDYCNYTTRFQLVIYKSNIECLFLSQTKDVYDSARTTCAAKNSRLFTAIQMERFEFFLYLTKNVINSNTWIGLSKKYTPGVWTWDNGEPFDTSKISSMFWINQPDNHGGVQLCCSSRLDRRTNLLDDELCFINVYYICETLF